MKLINIAASQLVKSSMSQMVFLHKKKMERVPTKAQKKGNEHADKISQGLAQELRGTVYEELFRLYFVIDALDNNIAFEIKNVEGDYEDWYFKSSILQSSFYFRLLDQVKYLDTPTFRKKEGYEEQFIDLNELEIITFILQFGDQSYYVEKDEDLYNHYMSKAELFVELVDYDWENAMYESKKWDSKFKFKEIEIFHPNYTHIEESVLTL